MVRKAPAAIILWALLVVGSAVLSVVSPIFAGVAVGAVVSAILLLLAVKWSIEDLVTNQMNSIDQMEEALGDNLSSDWPEPEE